MWVPAPWSQVPTRRPARRLCLLVARGVALCRCFCRRLSRGGLLHIEHLVADLALDLTGQGRVVLEELGSVGLALADLVALVGVPGARLLDQVELHTPVDDLGHAIDAPAVGDLELGLLEG